MTGEYYRRLGVGPTASREEIRAAYRALARRNHPDAQGIPADSLRMSELNEAWNVLRDDDRRRAYDAELVADLVSTARLATAPAAGRAPSVVTVPNPPTPFPWLLLTIMAVIGITFVLVNAAFTKPSVPNAPDNVIQIGSCVVLAVTGEAIEADCAAANDGVVTQLVPFDGRCPLTTSEYRDRQGMGLVCVDITKASE